MGRRNLHKHCPVYVCAFEKNVHTQGSCADSPSGLYWAMMVTTCPAPFSAAAACSCVAPRRSMPFTCFNNKDKSWDYFCGVSVLLDTVQ